MANAYITPGSDRFEIDEILRSPSFSQQYVQQAKMEYRELLRTEVRLAEKDLDMVNII